MQTDTEGLIIREQSVGESDRLVTALTRTDGLVRAFVRQAKNVKSRKASSTQLLSYSRLWIKESRDKYIITEAVPIHLFFGVRSELEKVALAQYFCELALRLAPENAPAEDFLRLMLHALYRLSEGTKDSLLLKAAVEMKLLSLGGYMPDLSGCGTCHGEASEAVFYPAEGILRCKNCVCEGEMALPLTAGALSAMRHVTESEPRELFAFSLSEESLRVLAQASECYVLCNLGKSLNSLDFYRRIIGK